MFWHWQDYTTPHLQERILPNGLMELTFNLSDRSFCIVSPDGLVQKHKSIVVGFRSKYFLIDTSQPTTLLSILFKSSGVIPFLGISAKDLHNKIVGLDEILGIQADYLHNQLLESTSVTQRFQVLETYLRDQLDQQFEHHYAVDTALSLFGTRDRSYSIAAVEQKVALSPPRFIQVFRDEIGVTPKMFTRIQRFQNALDLIATTTHHNWTDVALQCGYYDQSHMINDFQQFAGMTPAAYSPQDPEHPFNIPDLKDS